MSFLDDSLDLLSAWREGLATEKAVVAWADALIERLPSGAAPEWLLDVAMYGPAKCMARPSSEFIAVPPLGFLRALALRTALLNLEDGGSVEAFIRWASHACMGEDLDLPAVQFGYQLDHLCSDCDRMDLAVEFLHAQLPRIRGDLAPISADVLTAIVNNKTSAG